MHNSGYDELFFATKYVAGLKEDIRAIVEPHVPLTVDRAVVIAKIQQRTLERTGNKYTRPNQLSKPNVDRSKATTSQPTPQPSENETTHRL
jgi:hypothetical protein